MEVNRQEAQELLDEWQRLLRLRDWDIVLELVEPGWRKSGDIKINPDIRTAVLMLNQAPKVENLEEVVIHELLHLKLWSLDQMVEQLLEILYGSDPEEGQRKFAYGQFMTALESTVSDLTRSYLSTAGRTDPPSLGKLRDEVEAEKPG